MESPASAKSGVIFGGPARKGLLDSPRGVPGPTASAVRQASASERKGGNFGEIDSRSEKGRRTWCLEEASKSCKVNEDADIVKRKASRQFYLLSVV